MPPDPDPTPRDAEDVYAEYQQRAERGEDVDLEHVCDEHPRLAPALRALHSLHGDLSPDEQTRGDISLDGQTRTVGAPGETAGTFGEALGQLPAREDGAPLQPGGQVGPYTVQEVLGEGGFAFVFRAEQQEPVRRTVALKTLKLGMDTKQVLARFEAERQALALMSHRHIAKVFDAGMTADGRPYFVMEYVGGVPFTNYCDENRLPTRERLELFVSVCEAIAHAHQRAIIHRDLKPSNVLVTTEGDRPVPKVIDFGIAKAADQSLTQQTLFTEVGQVIGTPEYMSPEQAAGEAVDTRTDIYALGVLLYELLSGVRPFDSEKLRALGFPAILQFIQEAEPRKLSTRLTTEGKAMAAAAQNRGVTAGTLSREIRGDLDWITMKCLAKEPDRRYTTASELADDVQRHLRLEPVLAGPPTWTYRFSKFLRKRRTAVVATAGVLLTGLVVTFASLEIKERHDEEQRVRLSTQLVGKGDELRRGAGDLRAEILKQEQRYDEAKRSLPFWKPVWERGVETEEWRKLQDLERQLKDRYSQAYSRYSQALTLVRADTAAHKRAVDALKSLYLEVNGQGEAFVASGLLLQQLKEALGSEPSQSRTVRLQTDPPGATVYCFRYVEHEHRLLPVPYHPQRGTLDTPFLRIAALRTPRFLDNPRPAPLRPGDVVTGVDGHPVHTPSDFAARVRGVVDREVTLEIQRDGRDAAILWRPFASEHYGKQAARNRLQPGEVLDFGEQFGFTFEGYPLDVDTIYLDTDSTAISWRASTEEPLTFALSEGSYLFVLRKPGYRDARWPVSTRFPSELDETVRLVSTADAVPEGFVYVPAGTSILGGDDPSYLQNLRFGERRVDGFFMARFEVTFTSYLEFLNARGEADGKMLPGTEETRRELEKLNNARSGPVITHIELVPIDNLRGTPLAKQNKAGRWEPQKEHYRYWPALGISYMAAVEYAHWLSEARRDGWRYRLPTDVEWERAARGADGRRYVWGDYFTWRHGWNVRGNFRRFRLPPDEVGFCPTDESPFGIRDLAGSVREFTSGRPSGSSVRLVSTRGGGWDSLDEYEHRCDSRVGFPPERRSRNVGIRLVAERQKKE